MVPYFTSMATVLLEVFETNASNIKALRIFSYGISLLGKHPEIHALIAGSFDNICQIIMAKVFNPTKGAI